MPKGYLGGQEAAKIMLDRLKMDAANYRVGLTKVFFRAGVLAELEEQRDALIRDIMSRFQSVARGFMQRRIAFKQLYRAEATRVIQRNLNVYLDLQANPWWRLFVRMKPLLGATRTANEVKRRDEKIEQLHTKMQQDNMDRQRVEEDRRRAEMDMARVQQTLEAERALALDKEEIFRRLQDREGELSEKLAEAINEQEALEDQLDEALDAKKKNDEELTTRREQVMQAGQIITRLEIEKKELQQQVQKLEEGLNQVEKTHTQNDSKVECLNQEIRSLKSQINGKDRKISELESSIHQAERDRDLKTSNLEQEVRSLRSQLSQKDRRAEELEAKLTQKDRRTEEVDMKLRQLESSHRDDQRRTKEEFESQIRSLSSQVKSEGPQSSRARDRFVED